jgi:endothelin-converting enzyme/putative endopeptidase
MSETKVKAIEKLNKISIKIDIRTSGRDYSKLETKSIAGGGSYFENMRVFPLEFPKDIDKLDKAVDKTEWYMSPQTVNAYYNPSYNEIVFPAAILQRLSIITKLMRLLWRNRAVIGHEISHGFDDSGARYNADGNLVDWWTADDLTIYSFRNCAC